MGKSLRGLEKVSVEARNMGMSYGQYMAYLACHPEKSVREKASYSQPMFREPPMSNSITASKKSRTLPTGATV